MTALSASYASNLSVNSLSECDNIIWLDMCENDNIKTLENMRYLKYAYLYDIYSLTKDSLKNCVKIEELEFSANDDITTLNHMKYLQSLHAIDTNLTANSITGCIKLTRCVIRDEFKQDPNSSYICFFTKY